METNAQNYVSTEAKIRNVFLSDLHRIKSIYQESKNNSFDDDILHRKSSSLVSEDFGLPISLVEYQKEIIGYAFIIFNSLHEPEIQQLYKTGFEHTQTEHKLNKYAEKVLYSMQDNYTKDFSRLKMYVEKFIDWLNWCD